MAAKRGMPEVRCGCRVVGLMDGWAGLGCQRRVRVRLSVSRDCHGPSFRVLKPGGTLYLMALSDMVGLPGSACSGDPWPPLRRHHDV